MDPNVSVLLILLGVAAVTGVVVAIAQSERVKEYGLLGMLRREFSYGAHKRPVSHRVDDSSSGPRQKAPGSRRGPSGHS